MRGLELRESSIKISKIHRQSRAIIEIIQDFSSIKIDMSKKLTFVYFLTRKSLYHHCGQIYLKDSYSFRGKK